MKHQQLKVIVWGAAALGLILVATAVVAAVWQVRKFNRQISTLATQVTTLESNFASTSDVLSDTRGALDQARDQVESLDSKLSRYSRTVDKVSDKVGDLTKLSQLDPEILQKYSKVLFLNEHYAPAELVEIPTEYRYSESKPLKLEVRTWPFLKKLLDAAAKDGIKIYVFSAYRSFNEQGALKGQYSVTYGVGTANQFSADQGYSEHQLGTTVDLITTGLNGALDGFDKTPAYAWLQKNAYRFGFVLSYPPNNKYYVFEPWHWRFVGRNLAGDLADDEKNFYDLDQREIDKYLLHLFD